MTSLSHQQLTSRDSHGEAEAKASVHQQALPLDDLPPPFSRSRPLASPSAWAEVKVRLVSFRWHDSRSETAPKSIAWQTGKPPALRLGGPGSKQSSCGGGLGLHCEEQRDWPELQHRQVMLRHQHVLWKHMREGAEKWQLGLWWYSNGHLQSNQMWCHGWLWWC